MKLIFFDKLISFYKNRFVAYKTNIKINNNKKTSKKLKNINMIFFNFLFWVFLFVILLINFYQAGNIFVYEINHDHHMAFFSYLSGMAANGILPGIDFYSPHSILIPFIVGLFFKILGISQINLGISVGIVIFITMIFIYKTARLVMPNILAKLAVLTLLLSHSGRDIPWYNDVLMLFVAIGVYFLCAYIRDEKQYRLIIVGIIGFSLPYMRQAGIVISIFILLLPMILFYTGQIRDLQYKYMFKCIFISFIVANLAFFSFIVVKNGFEGLEILYSSLLSLVNMAQPVIKYDNTILDIASKLFVYTADGMDWHGYFMRFLSYWFIVIIPCLYFAYRPFSLFASKEIILNEDTIKFIVATITLLTIVFNYPINEDSRMRVQFGIGIWLFINVLFVCFYNKKIKILSIIAVSVVFLLLNHSKISQFVEKTIDNYQNIFLIKDGYYKMEANTPYSQMKFRIDYAKHLQDLLFAIDVYHKKYPNKMIIFDGELVDINNYLYLLFSGPKVGLQHKFPYYYGVFNRFKFYKNINDEFDNFVNLNKPIIIECIDNYRKTRAQEQYEVLKNINEYCNILVPKE